MRLGRKAVARIARPGTILAWYRQLVAEKFDGCKKRRTPGRPRTSPEIEDLVVRLARENSGCRVRKSLEEEELMMS
jgi:hypothetical protein